MGQPEQLDLALKQLGDDQQLLWEIADELLLGPVVELELELQTLGVLLGDERQVDLDEKLNEPLPPESAVQKVLGSNLHQQYRTPFRNPKFRLLHDRSDQVRIPDRCPQTDQL